MDILKCKKFTKEGKIRVHKYFRSILMCYSEIFSSSKFNAFFVDPHIFVKNFFQDSFLLFMHISVKGLHNNKKIDIQIIIQNGNICIRNTFNEWILHRRP